MNDIRHKRNARLRFRKCLCSRHNAQPQYRTFYQMSNRTCRIFFQKWSWRFFSKIHLKFWASLIPQNVPLSLAESKEQGLPEVCSPVLKLVRQTVFPITFYDGWSLGESVTMCWRSRSAQRRCCLSREWKEEEIPLRMTLFLQRPCNSWWRNNFWTPKTEVLKNLKGFQ